MEVFIWDPTVAFDIIIVDYLLVWCLHVGPFNYINVIFLIIQSITKRQTYAGVSGSIIMPRNTLHRIAESY